MLFRSRRSVRSALVAVVLCLSGTTAAYADEEEDTASARKHFARGLELVDEGAFAQAVTEFEWAYRLKPYFAVLYNIGLAHAATGNAVLAVDTLERYLIDGGALISEARRREVEAELARQRARIALLEIDVIPAGASVKVDGIDVGTSPLASPVRVGIGRHVVSATGSGLTPAESPVVVAGEERARVTLRLTAVPPPAVTLVPFLPPMSSGGGASTARTQPESEARRPNRTLAIVSLGIGAAIGATTLGLGVWNQGRYDDWQSAQRNIDNARHTIVARGGNLVELVPRQADNDELILSVHRSDRVALGLGLASAAFLATGIVLWFFGNDAAKLATPRDAVSSSRRELVHF